MDTSNGRPTQRARGAVGDPTMESHNWRAQPQRRRIVNKIMDILKKNLPFSEHERLQELKKVAERVEGEIYTAATSQSEYSRKICFMMLTIETRLQNPMVDSMQSSSADNPNGGDWQQEVYQKIRAMKNLYLLDLMPIQDARDGVADPAVASNDWRAQLQADSRQRIVIKIMDTLKKHLPFSGPEGLQEVTKIATKFEEKIYTTATSQSDYLRKISLKMLSVETRSQNPLSDPMQSNSAALYNSLHHSVPYNLIAHTDNPNGGDLQQEVYQKIEATRDPYLLDLMPIQDARDGVADPAMASNDWRAQLKVDSRPRIVIKIMDTLKKHLPFSGPEGLQEVTKIATKFEEKIYTTATSQCDYLRKISLKMVSMES